MKKVPHTVLGLLASACRSPDCLVSPSGNFTAVSYWPSTVPALAPRGQTATCRYRILTCNTRARSGSVCGVIFRTRALSLVCVCRMMGLLFGLGALVYLAIPSLIHSGPNPQAWCCNNLRLIDGAKEQLVLQKNLTNGTEIFSRGYIAIHQRWIRRA